jgi:undecaprenyl-phosphate 4-deoxy-4-formamido-L-arabinose transferase
VFDAERFQVVLVDDGSQDNSHQVCQQLVQDYPDLVTYVQLAKNFGEHNAVMAGLHQTNGEYVVIMDDDFQNPPQEVPRLVKYASEHHYDIVYTYYQKKQHHFVRNLGSIVHNWMASFILEKPKDLYLSSFKCLSRFAVREIIQYTGPFPYIDGLALRCTRNIGKIEVLHAKREEGRSGYTLRKLIRVWLSMFVNFSVMPLRISSLLGVVLSGIGVVMGLVAFIEKLLYPEVQLGWASLFFALMLFSGTQLLMLGLIGEYLGRMFLGTNQTPQFVIRKVYRGKE